VSAIAWADDKDEEDRPPANGVGSAAADAGAEPTRSGAGGGNGNGVGCTCVCRRQCLPLLEPGPSGSAPSGERMCGRARSDGRYP
jgi:hypothetical protein